MNTEKIQSYFYVFVGRENEDSTTSKPRITRNYRAEKKGTSNIPLDYVVSSAFNRLEEKCDNEVKVFINPDKYNELRKVFNIERMPAFGLSRNDITNVEVKPNPKKIPEWWEIHKRKERKKVLESGEFYPGIQRNIISLFSNDPDEMFNFIRDIHTANVDGGIPKVMDVITVLLKEKDIKNVGELIGKARKLFPW